MTFTLTILLAFAAAWVLLTGIIAFTLVRDRVCANRAINRRLRQSISASTSATTAKATANPPAKIKTRIISDKPFVLLRTP